MTKDELYVTRTEAQLQSDLKDALFAAVVVKNGELKHIRLGRGAHLRTPGQLLRSDLWLGINEQPALGRFLLMGCR